MTTADHVLDARQSVRWLRRDAHAAQRGGPDALARRADRRLRQLVAHARAHSPFYADLYRSVDSESFGLRDLPTTNKRMLMGAFDDWATDRRVTSDAVQAFVADGAPGDRFLNDYMYSETSGTSGVRGRFVSDAPALTVVRALGSRQRRATATQLWTLARKRARLAAVINLGGHHVTAALLRTAGESDSTRRRLFLDCTAPVDEMCRTLDDFDPAVLTGYASVLSVLATEQIGGRLHITPITVNAMSENVSAADRDRFRRAWPKALLTERYAANECHFAAERCGHGAHHLNSDWVVLEPVDERGAAVPPGVRSSSVLLTNLSNLVQPIIRYDLGDSIRLRDQPCPCGSVLPAFDVLGRNCEIVRFETAHGPVTVTGMSLKASMMRVPGVVEAQAVRRSETLLTVRVRVAPDAHPTTVRESTRRAVAEMLADNGVRHVRVTVDETLPQRTEGGKLLRLVDEVAGAAHGTS